MTIQKEHLFENLPKINPKLIGSSIQVKFVDGSLVHWRTSICRPWIIDPILIPHHKYAQIGDGAPSSPSR